jgi:Trypsin-like peptidase domain
MKKLLFGLVAMVVWSYGAMMSMAFAANNPVVQIVWYDAVWWRYPNMLWWGSASIISNNGLILTNNHVVDNGRGGTLPWFSICITVDDTQRPKCHYTASLIARDIRRDVALLRIDPVDIFGKSVNFADLTTIELDYSYVPKAQDTVVAIWYPWVGANTITKTQWVVAGTQPYNDVTYIKTDALIAGGNSGWPLTLNGKMIGINTFGMGWGFDASLWYALSIAEAKDFITTNSTKSATSVSPRLGFAEYLRRLEQINIDRRVSDSFVAMKFDTSYKVTHYIPNLQLRWEISNPDIYHVQQFNIQRINLPKFKDIKEQEFFLKNQMQLYGSRWSTEKLKIKKIGGLDFYEPVYSSDPSGGEWYGYKKYFTVVDGTMVIVTLYAPLWDENTQDQVKSNIDSFLANLSFGSISTLPRQEFELYDPAIKLLSSDQSLVDVFGQMNWWFSEYYGWRSSYIQYLGNLYETLGLTVEANTLYGGKGKTAQQLLDAATADTYGSTIVSKWLVNYYGNEWYMVCSNDQRSEMVDAQGRSHKMASCMMRIVVWSKQEHIVSFALSVEKSKIESRKKEFFAFVEKVMKPLGNATLWVKIADELKPNANEPKFNDIADQDPTLQKFLNKLVIWWILKQNSSFNGDYPLLWQDYIKLYLKMVYNKNLTDIWSNGKTYGDLVATLPYSPSAFVPASQAYYNSSFETLLKIKLAWVAYPDLSEYGLARFERLKDTTYRDQWNQIQERAYSIYGQRQISLYESLGSVNSYQSDYSLSYNPITRELKKTPMYSKEPIRLDQWVSVSIIKSTTDQMWCYENKVTAISQRCLTLWKEQIAQYVGYPIVTKWDAINNLMNKMDIGLFDSYWAKKKETQIEEQVAPEA